MPGSWERMEGTRFCSITAVPSLPPWKNAIPKVLGKDLLLDAKPWCSTVLHPLSQQKSGKKLGGLRFLEGEGRRRILSTGTV